MLAVVFLAVHQSSQSSTFSPGRVYNERICQEMHWAFIGMSLLTLLALVYFVDWLSYLQKAENFVFSCIVDNI